MRLHNSRVSPAARGFTLIEAMVTLVVLSVGLLGVAALQLTGMRNSQGSAARTQATMLAYDIVDRMRANRRAAVMGNYNIAFGNRGTSGTVAGDDLVAWKTALRGLPRGDVDGDGALDDADGSITREGPNGDIFVVTIAWGDARPSTDDADGNASTTDPALQFTLRTQLSN